MTDQILIKKNKSKNNKEKEPQEAVAGAIADERNKQASENKILYLVKAEDPSVTGGVKYFFSLKNREDNNVLLGIKGFEVKKTITNKINNYQEAESYVDSGKVELINIRLPWTKVISIEQK